jgi:hypothetical protein
VVIDFAYKGKGNPAVAEPQLRIWRDKKEFGKEGYASV